MSIVSYFLQLKVIIQALPCPVTTQQCVSSFFQAPDVVHPSKDSFHCFSSFNC